MRVFLDTAFLWALDFGRDQYHEEATAHWDIAEDFYTGFVTTTFIFDEVVTQFNSRGLHSKAVEIGNWLQSSDHVELVLVDNTLLDSGWEHFQRHSDKLWSLTDCISFVVMQERGLTTALTFDHHFTQAGFLVEPSTGSSN